MDTVRARRLTLQPNGRITALFDCPWCGRFHIHRVRPGVRGDVCESHCDHHCRPYVLEIPPELEPLRGWAYANAESRLPQENLEAKAQTSSGSANGVPMSHAPFESYAPNTWIGHALRRMAFVGGIRHADEPTHGHGPVRRYREIVSE